VVIRPMGNYSFPGQVMDKIRGVDDSPMGKRCVLHPEAVAIRDRDRRPNPTTPDPLAGDSGAVVLAYRAYERADVHRSCVNVTRCP